MLRMLSLVVLLMGFALQTQAQFPVRGTYLDFFRALTPERWADEFDRMQQVGIDTVVITAVGHLRADASDPLGYSLAGDGLLYPSMLVDLADRPTEDRLLMILQLAQTRGMQVYLGSLQTEGDWTTGLEFAALRSYNQQVALEVLQLYDQVGSLAGWYFTQEIWMNWVQFYGPATYYGTLLAADFVNDMHGLDPGKTVAHAPVFKKDPFGSMPGLTPAELQVTMDGFLSVADFDLVMPQDGIGALDGAPSLSEIGSYFAAARVATDAQESVLWSTVEFFENGSPEPNSEWKPASISRIAAQIDAESPHVSGFVMYAFGNHMSDQATFWPVESYKLWWDFHDEYYSWFLRVSEIPVVSYSFDRAPDVNWPDSGSELSDGTGGGYSQDPSWVGFNSDQVVITLDFGFKRRINRILTLHRSQGNSGIYYPSQIIVEVSSNGNSYKFFGQSTTFPADTEEFSIGWGDIYGDANIRYVRITLDFSQWVFLAEILVLDNSCALPRARCGN